MSAAATLRTIAGAALLALGALPAAAVTLAEAYEAALKYDAEYLSARHELDSAREELPIARAALLPSVSLNAARSQVEGRREFANALSQQVQVPLDYASPQASLTLRTPVFNYEALSRTRQAASSVEAAEETFRARQIDLISRLASTYLQAVGSVDDLALAEWEVQALQGQLERARRRHERGEGTLTEIARTEAAFDLARARVLEAADAVAVARRALRRISGLDAATLLKPQSGFKPQPLLPERLQDWMDLALRQNPVIRAREQGVTTARLGIDRSRAGHMPRLDFVASLSQSRNESPTNVNQTSSLRSIGVQLSVPLYSGGGVDASVRQSIAVRDKAEEDVRAGREAVLLDVERYYRAAASAPDKIGAYERAVHSSQIELRGASRAQELGTGTVSDVLDARTRYNTALRDLGLARLNYLDSRLKLMSVAGLPVEAVIDDIARVLTDEVTLPARSQP